MRRLISLGIGFTLTAAVACSGVGTSPENIDATVRAAVAETQEAQPTATTVPTPSPTPVPEYTPDLADYIVAMRESDVPPGSLAYSMIIDRFDDYAMVYPFAERLIGKEPSAEGFRSFLATNLLHVQGQGRPGVIARQQLKEITELSLQQNPSEWVIAIANPESAADSEVLCRMTDMAFRAGFAPIVQLSFPDCRVLYAEYDLSSGYENFAHYLDGQGYF